MLKKAVCLVSGGVVVVTSMPGAARASSTSPNFGLLTASSSVVPVPTLHAY